MQDFYLDFVEQLPDDVLRLEGYVVETVDSLELQATSGSFLLRPNGATHEHITRRKETVTVRVLSVDIPLTDTDKLEIINSSGRPMRIRANRYSGLGNITGAYTKKGKVLYRKGRRLVSLRPYSRVRVFCYEAVYLLRILVNWRIASAKDNFLYNDANTVKRLAKAVLIVGEAIVTIPQALLLRLLSHYRLANKRRPVWLVGDRGMAAGDSGEAFFRHLYQQHAGDTRDAIFVLSRSSPDFNRMERYGKVIDPGSFAYKLIFLTADKIISSHADVEVTNPFLRQIDRYVGFYTFDFVFLQHGIIRNDLSSWLNRYEKNIALFVTSAQREYDSILEYPYYYTEKNVLLSGLPRYDLLRNTPRKKLLIAPTYRKSLLRLKTDRYGVRGYDDEFKKSNYFVFYNQLLNDTRLHEAMKAAGMVGEFYIHPNFAMQRDDFQTNDHFTIPEYPYDYRQAFAQGSLLVSDYSSVVFDFAYLGKPVIYTHFDIDTFFEGHAYAQGDFFSDETDGFGPVTYTLDELIERIVGAIHSGCEMELEYRKRAKDFFAWHDQGNAERVYQAIVERLESSV